MAQGLDRRLTIGIEAEGTVNQHGEYLPGPVIEHGVWATREDVSLETNLEAGGSRTETRRDVVVRWRADIASTPPARLTFTDAGVNFQVVNVVEITADGRQRRRWLRLQGSDST